MFSFGAFVFEPKKKQDDNSNRNVYMNILLAFLLFSILVSFLLVVYIRKRLLHKARVLDSHVYTPSDFCLMGTNMRFDNYSPEEITKTVKEEFKRLYNIDDIIYINPVYDIADFYKIFNK